jgi:putative phage-type endonuclease
MSETTVPVTRTAPEGVFLGDFTPGTPEWDAARGGLCITATEIAAVLGLSPWMSRFTLWHKKAGLPTAPFEMNPAIEWGSRLEPAVIGKFADEHPEWILGPAGTWRHREREWQRATPDQLLYPVTPATDWAGASDVAAQPTELLEAKTSPYGDDWPPAGSDAVPVWYRCQAIWQMDTLGIHTRTRIGLLVSGHDYREYVVEYDPADAALMRQAAREFLDTVTAGQRPPIDTSDSTYQTIRRQAEGRDDVEVEIPPEMADRYETAQAIAKAAAEELTGAKAAVLDAIGANRWAAVAQRRIAQRTVRADGTTLALQPCKQKADAA